LFGLRQAADGVRAGMVADRREIIQQRHKGNDILVLGDFSGKVEPALSPANKPKRLVGGR
jgi:hypothetical protein